MRHKMYDGFPNVQACRNYRDKNGYKTVLIPKQLYEILKSGEYGKTILESCKKIAELIYANKIKE